MKHPWLAIALIAIVIIIFVMLFFIIQIIIDVRERVCSIDNTISSWDTHISQGNE